MEWAKLRYTRREVNEAGKYLVGVEALDFDENKVDEALDIVDNFRASHAFPLNTLQNRLRLQAKRIDRKSIIAQRLKRLSSILYKLDRFETMDLWDMQDIGGCRAVVSNIEDVKRVVDSFKLGRIRHKLAHEDDYIEQPRDSGYRSWHLIYRYYSDRNEVYNSFKIEIQIRTFLQHAWATAVETIDAFTKQALKSSRGERDWERFFQLMGTWMAIRENTTLVQSTPTSINELRQELRACANELQVAKSLAGFTAALRITRRPSVNGADYLLLYLDNVSERLNVTGYARRELRDAARTYARIEKRIRKKEGTDAVLVSVDSIRNLRRAYPNYFADTRMFVEELNRAVK